MLIDACCRVHSCCIRCHTRQTLSKHVLHALDTYWAPHREAAMVSCIAAPSCLALAFLQDQCEATSCQNFIISTSFANFMISGLWTSCMQNCIQPLDAAQPLSSTLIGPDTLHCRIGAAPPEELQVTHLHIQGNDTHNNRNRHETTGRRHKHGRHRRRPLQHTDLHHTLATNAMWGRATHHLTARSFPNIQPYPVQANTQAHD